MPTAMRFSCIPFLSHDQTLELSSLPQFRILVLSIFLTSCFHPVCTNYVHCLLYGWLTLAISHYGFFFFIVVLACAITCLCVSRMTNIINVLILECIAGCLFFPPLPKWWWLQTPWFTLFALSTLCRWCQKGEDGHDHGYFGLTWLELLSPDFFSSLPWLVWH